MFGRLYSRATTRVFLLIWSFIIAMSGKVFGRRRAAKWWSAPAPAKTLTRCDSSPTGCDSEAAQRQLCPVTSSPSDSDSSDRHRASKPSMTNSEPPTHLDLADPAHPACSLAAVCRPLSSGREIMSATLLYPVGYDRTPTRQVLRRTEFLGSLVVSYVLIMIMVACPTSR